MYNADNQNHNKEAVASPSSDESPTKIFKLTIDCLDEIFEYLSLKDLHSFGQTCKRMNKVAGEYFKQNYSSAPNLCKVDGIYTNYDKDDVTNEQIHISGFNKFMPCISYCGHCPQHDFGAFKYTKSHINEFEATNHIYLGWLSINCKTVEHFKQLLPQLGIVQYQCCSVDGDIYDLILKYCKNLREIYVQGSDGGKRINGKFNWLLQEYPKLERLEWRPNDPCKIEELRDFFIRNPNVKRFSTTSKFWWTNGDIFSNSKAKLDIFEIKGFYVNTGHDKDGDKILKSHVNLLNRLYEQGFYKRLYIYVDSVYEEKITAFASIKGLELLFIRWFQKSYNLAQLTNLRELMIMYGSKDPKDMEVLANGLTKLERLNIGGSKIDDIMPFIRRSPKLNKIKFIPRNKDVVLNLAMMNEERAKLVGARKIIIYTRDDVFLATKWTTRNGDINLSFIEMRRLDSIEWNHHIHPYSIL
ncbi:uncharacterized protein LOC116346603 [Contarinia nasturtii]|uniref:uncharacterized protein LOC116346603 n=1 Tax=Contarinia nasturtii TaxID=265458 RepID=UPI0012D4B919|nr:uncharacterized protein LOC116346603 [Contarinia nasturtii]